MPGGHCRLHYGEIVGGHYRVVKKIECGYFSTVWHCLDEYATADIPLHTDQ